MITVTVTHTTPPDPQPDQTRAVACVLGTFLLPTGTRFRTLQTVVAATFGYHETEITFTKAGMPLAAQPNGYNKPNKKLKDDWHFSIEVSLQAKTRAKVLGEQMARQGRTFPGAELNDFELEVDSCRAAAAAAAAKVSFLVLLSVCTQNIFGFWTGPG